MYLYILFIISTSPPQPLGPGPPVAGVYRTMQECELAKSNSALNSADVFCVEVKADSWR